MSEKYRLSFCKGDIIAVALVAALIFSVWAFLKPEKENGAAAQIFLDGELINELPLDVDGVFYVEGEYRNTIEISDGKVWVAESDCPGTDCVYSGVVSKVGRSIVCLPNRMEIRIIGAPEENAVDFVVG